MKYSPRFASAICAPPDDEPVIPEIIPVETKPLKYTFMSRFSSQFCTDWNAGALDTTSPNAITVKEREEYDYRRRDKAENRCDGEGLVPNHLINSLPIDAVPPVLSINMRRSTTK